MKLLVYALGLFVLIGCAERKTSDNPNQPANKSTKPAETSASGTNNAPVDNSSSNSNAGQTKVNDGSIGHLAPPTQGTVASDPNKPQQTSELITEIFGVMDLMMKDNVVLTRDKEMITCTDGAKRLKAIFIANKSQINTWEDFLQKAEDGLASSGSPYTVTTKERKESTLSDYLNGLRKKFKKK